MPEILTARSSAASRPVPVADSHWIEFDAPRLGRRQKRALCGDIVDEGRFSTEPTCARCREEMARLEGQEF